MNTTLINGQALNDQGFFTGFATISPMALMTNGFIIAGGDIWQPVLSLPTTTWTTELQ